MNAQAEKHALVPFRVYLWVWAALICLTGITVGAQFTNLQHLAVFTAILIATVKAGLVILYFMHVRFEKPLFAVMILAVLCTYGIFLGLTFADYIYR